MVLEYIYEWLKTQEKSFVYYIRTDDLPNLFVRQVSFYSSKTTPTDIATGDRFYLLDGYGEKRPGSLIVKDVILQKESYGSETVEIKYAVFDIPINIGVPAACRNDRALIVRTSDTVVMLRKIINYILNGNGS